MIGIVFDKSTNRGRGLAAQSPMVKVQTNELTPLFFSANLNQQLRDR